MHPGCVGHLVSVSPVHGVGIPEHVPVPFVHKHPFEERHVALSVFDEQGLDVPEQVPVPLSQLQPLAERQVVLDMLVEHGTGVPVQVAVEDQVQPLAERQVLLMVFETQVVGVPEQVPVAALHVQPLVSPPLYGHVVLLGFVEHAAGVPVHVARL